MPATGPFPVGSQGGDMGFDPDPFIAYAVGTTPGRCFGDVGIPNVGTAVTATSIVARSAQERKSASQVDGRSI